MIIRCVGRSESWGARLQMRGVVACKERLPLIGWRNVSANGHHEEKRLTKPDLMGEDGHRFHIIVCGTP